MKKDNTQKLILGDCLKSMYEIESNSIDVIVTSPPYNKKGLAGGKIKPGNQVWKKFNIDYSEYDDNLSEEDYSEWMVNILNEMMRIIKVDGSIFFNHKPRRHKNKVHLPTDFISKSDLNIYQLIIWNRLSSPNIRKDVLLPCTEHIYWLCKSKPKTYKDNIDSKFNSEVWIINPDRGNKHPAPFPKKLVETCLLLTSKEGDLVLDPFLGSGTTAVVSDELNRNFIGIELDEKYLNITKSRLGIK
jgi:site-specific DNA-methyltransferase (adenine-specific)